MHTGWFDINQTVTNITTGNKTHTSWFDINQACTKVMIYYVPKKCFVGIPNKGKKNQVYSGKKWCKKADVCCDAL